MDRFKSGQKLLSQQRYQFPNAWLYAEHVEGEWTALTDVLHRKDTAIQSQVNLLFREANELTAEIFQVSNLQSRIKEEDEIVEKRMQEILGDWAKSRPVQGAHKPKDALQLLGSFEDKFNKLKDDRANMVRAKTALDISDTVGLTEYITKLDVAMEELTDLKGWQRPLAFVCIRVRPRSKSLRLCRRVECAAANLRGHQRDQGEDLALGAAS